LTFVYTDFGVPGASTTSLLSTISTLKLDSKLTILDNRPCVSISLKGSLLAMKEQAQKLVESLSAVPELKEEPMQAVSSSPATATSLASVLMGTSDRASDRLRSLLTEKKLPTMVADVQPSTKRVSNVRVAAAAAVVSKATSRSDSIDLDSPTALPETLAVLVPVLQSHQQQQKQPDLATLVAQQLAQQTSPAARARASSRSVASVASAGAGAAGGNIEIKTSARPVSAATDMHSAGSASTADDGKWTVDDVSKPGKVADEDKTAAGFFDWLDRGCMASNAFSKLASAASDEQRAVAYNFM
jgi:hypothetical protein